MIYLDTHVVIWLYMGEKERLSRKAQSMVEHERLSISPMVLLELQYLYEKGRLEKSPEVVLEYLVEMLDLSVNDISFERLVVTTSRNTWTRDTFDRIISAQAQVDDALLLTKDQNILDNCEWAVW